MAFLMGPFQSGGEVGVHLNIADSVTGADVPVAGVPGYDGDYIQTIGVSYAPMILTQVGSALSPGDETASHDSKRKSEMLIKILCSENHAPKIRVIWVDSNGILAYSLEYTLTQTGIQEAGQYLAEAHINKILGASMIAIRLTELTSGTADIHVATI